MKTHPTIIKILTAAILSVCFLQPVAALEVTIKDTTITIKANDNSLREVLEELNYAGVDVLLDPGVQAQINGEIIDEEINKAMDKLLGSYGYVLKWEIIQGPLGDLTRLSQLTVYRNGYQRKVQKLPAKKTALSKLIIEADGTMYFPDELLVGMKKGTTMSQFKAALAGIRGAVVESVPEMGIYRIRLPKGTNIREAVRALKRNPGVAVSEPNYAAKTPGANPEALTPKQETAQNKSPAKSKSPDAKVDGGSSATLIAILDSGFNPRQDLGGSVVGSFNATDPSARINDKAGHGTQMAYIGSGYIAPEGTAFDPDSSLNPVYPIKTFDEQGLTSNFILSEAINQAIQKDAKIISMSWGSETDSSFVRSAVEFADRNGSIIIASAGNEATGRPVYPAAYPETISVGALNQNGVRWENSNYGNTVDVVAPGFAYFPIGYKGPPGAYVGTSIAAPYVANAIAQKQSLNPKASPAEIRKAFIKSLTDAGAPGRDDYYGHGVFDEDAKAAFLK